MWAPSMRTPTSLGHHPVHRVACICSVRQSFESVVPLWSEIPHLIGARYEARDDGRPRIRVPSVVDSCQFVLYCPLSAAHHKAARREKIMTILKIDELERMVVRHGLNLDEP